MSQTSSMAIKWPIPKGFVFLTRRVLSEDSRLLPRSQFSTVESLNSTLRQYYGINLSSVDCIIFIIKGGMNRIIATVEQAHWNELYQNEAFNCISIHSTNIDFFGMFGTQSCDKKYTVYLSKGYWQGIQSLMPSSSEGEHLAARELASMELAIAKLGMSEED
ncbi:hypothetical protein K440DRAFT_132220 [Wilcoxina mikolae CBS 423.85]|nr:hypothetical protein K440DRAFT_132220 [Wilcoxina mikolae CBS 423.85]